MKKRLAVAFFSAAGIGAVFTVRAQSIEAHEVGTGTGQVSHWETSWGSYDRDYHETKKIRVIVRDISRSLTNAEVRIYFIGRKAEGERFIYNHAILQVPLNGNLEASDEIAAPSLLSNEQNYALANSHYSSGAHMEGWIAIGLNGSNVFGQAASNQNLLTAAQDGSLDQLIAKAKIHHGKPASGSRRGTKRVKAASPPNLPAVVPKALNSPAASPPNLSPAIPGAGSNSVAVVAQFVTVTAPTEVIIEYGKTVLPIGTRLKLISRDGANVSAVYMNQTIVIPISATDLTPSGSNQRP